MTFFSDPGYGALLSIVLVSFVVSLGINIVYKFTTNQRLMKQMREDIKKFQTQMRSTKDTSKLMAIQKKAMDVNMRYMMQSMRPTFFTLIPVLIVFWWMAAHLSVAQILPGEEFSVTAALEEAGNVSLQVPSGVTILSSTQTGSSANFTLTGSEGTHTLTFSSGDEFVEKDVLITTKWDFVQPTVQKQSGLGAWVQKLFDPGRQDLPKDSVFSSIHVAHKPVHPFGEFTIFGYQPGWVATYILWSLVFSILLRRLMGLN